MDAKLNQKGQVTIPKRLRDHLGLKPGAAIKFGISDDGRVLLDIQRAAKDGKNPFRSIRGSATAQLTTEQIMAMTRGED